jgi:hypothetical protein
MQRFLPELTPGNCEKQCVECRRKIVISNASQSISEAKVDGPRR